MALVAVAAVRPGRPFPAAAAAVTAQPAAAPPAASVCIPRARFEAHMEQITT